MMRAKMHLRRNKRYRRHLRSEGLVEEPSSEMEEQRRAPRLAQQAGERTFPVADWFWDLPRCDRFELHRPHSFAQALLRRAETPGPSLRSQSGARADRM